VEGEEGLEAIQKLDEDFDLLMLTQVDRGIFEKLYSKSMAKELIQQSQNPVYLNKYRRLTPEGPDKRSVYEVYCLSLIKTIAH